MLAAWIVTVPDLPSGIFTSEGVTEIEKSRTTTVMLTICCREPLVPLTVTVYEPTGPEQYSVEVAEGPRDNVAGLVEQVKPEGDAALARFTVPVNPLTGATVIEDIHVTPATTFTDVGLEEIVKSWTVTGTVIW